MCERLDPEEVKEITSRIFGEITKIVAKYEGFIEKFIGDAAMAIFGATKTYEDDPVRAIRTAREIHLLVESLSPKYEKKIGQPLSMHSGINTGLVVTGEVNLRKGTHGISGDTINLAARLSSLGEPGDILVDPDTHNQAQGYFNFEDLGLTKVKGKTESVQVYKVITPKEQPHKVRRVHGLRAKLIGRKVEIAQLEEAVYKLKNGKVSIFSICGAAGTGKSRLVEEFKAMLDLEKIQWREGHAYSYAQNIPYFPLINLLSRAFQIEEGDSRKKVRSRVESGIKILAGKDADIIPYIGSLFDLSYPELEGMSPDSWKFNLHKAIQEILSALLLRAPTVICLEDLHWADPSSIELFRLILKKTKHPAIFLCTYRPVITLFSSHQFGILDKLYQEINLHDLSPSEMQEMLKSLLKTKNIPPDLRKFVQGMIEGNPFYLEEVINSLIESETLIRKNEDWVLSRPITKYRTPPTIQGVIAARLDHLGIETKRALQEASVIGRIFLYDILKRISVFKDRIDECLKGLELHDLIRTKSLQPELEYVFKHAMTQEVVYNGILKKERKAVHGQIGLVMEKLFYDRLSEFYEALAFHFERSQFAHKALDYLVKSGEKSIGRYALEESQQYFKQAFDLISEKPKKTKEEKKILVDLLIKWAFVFHLRGSYSDLTNLLKAHEDIAVSIDDKEKLGMFYAWLGLALQSREKLKDAHQYLHKALKIAEEINHYKVIGYANAWLAQTCADLGLLDDAIVFGKNAIETSRNFKSDQSLFSSSYRALGYAYWFRGECDNTKEVGNILLNYGQNQSDIRSITLGHMYIGMGHHIAGDFPHAIERYQRAIQLSEDPRFLNSAKLILGMSYISDGKHQEAENTLEEVMRFSEEYGSEYLGTAAQGLFGIVLLAKGNLKKGVKITEDVLKEFDEKGSRYRFAGLNFVLGNVYLQIVQKNEPKSISFIAKNIGFLMKNVPFASKKAEFHFKKTIEVAKEISSKSYLGRAYLSLGSLHKAKGRIDQARKYISRAVIVFEQCEADVFLKQAKEALKALG
jgi:class 3 adenylate cyclase/tetratricopeptide (TPR) repeat protein